MYNSILISDFSINMIKHNLNTFIENTNTINFSKNKFDNENNNNNNDVNIIIMIYFNYGREMHNKYFQHQYDRS